MHGSDLRPGTIVVIAALDDIPQHLFLIESIEEDCITGTALSGPLEGCYGEPEFALIVGLHTD